MVKLRGNLGETRILGRKTAEFLDLKQIHRGRAACAPHSMRKKFVHCFVLLSSLSD